MPFSWTANPVAGGEILAADMNEIRTNADWIKDNLACVTDYTSNYSSHNNGDDTSNLTYCLSDNGTHQTNYYSSDNAPHHVGYLSGEYVGEYSGGYH